MSRTESKKGMFIRKVSRCSALHFFQSAEFRADSPLGYRFEIRTLKDEFPKQFTLLVKGWAALYTAEGKHLGATYRSIGSCSHYSIVIMRSLIPLRRGYSWLAV